MLTILKGGADKYTYVSLFGQEVRVTGGGCTKEHTRIRMDLLDSDEVGSELILEI
jgi:hypothetical protein